MGKIFHKLLHYLTRPTTGPGPLSVGGGPGGPPQGLHTGTFRWSAGNTAAQKLGAGFFLSLGPTHPGSAGEGRGVQGTHKKGVNFCGAIEKGQNFPWGPKASTGTGGWGVLADLPTNAPSPPRVPKLKRSLTGCTTYSQPSGRIIAGARAATGATAGTAAIAGAAAISINNSLEERGKTSGSPFNTERVHWHLENITTSRGIS